ncbi:hypothetical protein Q757_00435 [Oenococcus alcoholitolerans]|uniref:Sugar ABC transporter permease n=1 Tax=Oenococcus alcoholitolerans TaxID=931074 RepID=A0ABR4XU89_9LACO|nr:hypothetical protein Q757_00435 [Oenococcus alcoholitolerans]
MNMQTVNRLESRRFLEKRNKTVTASILAFWGLITILPFLWMFLSSF